MEKLLRVFFSGLTKVCISSGGEGDEDELGRIGLRRLLAAGGMRGQCLGW